MLIPHKSEDNFVMCSWNEIKLKSKKWNTELHDLEQMNGRKNYKTRSKHWIEGGKST